jgi:hypothetical protein
LLAGQSHDTSIIKPLWKNHATRPPRQKAVAKATQES